MSVVFNDAERLLLSLGIDDPKQISLPEISHSLGLSIRYAALKSCDARLVGLGDRGIITVRQDANPHRQRFSIAHEIGHWIYHKHRALLCNSASIDETASQATKSIEKKANEFASALLMPRYLAELHVRSIPSATFGNIRKLSADFNVSVTVAARRVVESGRFPIILISYKKSGRAWFLRSPILSSRLYPQADLHPESGAMSVLFREVDGLPAMRRPAGHFFDLREASGAMVREEIFRSHEDGVLSLVTIEDKLLAAA